MEASEKVKNYYYGFYNASEDREDTFKPKMGETMWSRKTHQ